MSCFWRRQTIGYHSVFGWWFLPLMDARIPLGRTYHRLITNSVGMRSHREYPREAPSGRRRVVFLGDSYTAGDGVSNNQRFTDRLEERFAQLDALNFGLSGAGTDQQLLIYEHLARHYAADAYVFCVCVENIARNLYTCFPSYDWSEHHVVYRPKPYFELADGELVLHNQPVPRDKRPHDQLGDWRCAFPYIAGEADPYAIYRDPQSHHWLLMKQLLLRFIDQAAGRPVFIVPLPMYQHYLEEAGPTYWPRFAELEDTMRGVHVVDLLPAFKAQPMATRLHLRFPDDPHYTGIAHWIVAEALEYQFARHLPMLLQ